MAAKKNQKALLKKLKKQVALLQRKEAKSRNQLKAALKKIRKLGRSYKVKLIGRMHAMKNKLVKTQAATYAKVAEDVGRQMQKGIEAKGKSLRSALHKFEKKYIAKLTKGIAKKGKKAKKIRKTKKSSVTKAKSRGKRKSTRRGRSRARRR